MRAAERALGLREPGRAPRVVHVDADGRRLEAAEREVRSRQTGAATFGGWRFEKG